MSRVALITFATIVVLSLFIFFIFSETLPIKMSSLFYTIGTSWLFIFIYMFIITLFGDLVRATGLVSSSTITNYTRDNWIVFAFIVAFVSLLMLSGYLKYRTKERVEIPININKTICAGNDGKGLKIVALGDLHLGYGIGVDELEKWVQLINEEKADIVLISGDIIDNSVRPLREYDMAKHLQQIKSKYGVYTILGNHEYISGLSESTKFIKDAGITLLKDEAVMIDSCFYVIGRDDKTNPNRKPLAELVNNLDKSKPIILLDHQPYNLEEAEQNGIDFQFSGHTHRGQVWPISLITDWIYEDSYGFLKKGDTHVYVTSGMGIWGGKFRIGTQSEYVVIDLNSK